ncbi:MAG: hypothetical protein U0531_04430 [Dehalococcoidia bacterium]
MAGWTSASEAAALTAAAPGMTVAVLGGLPLGAGARLRDAVTATGLVVVVAAAPEAETGGATLCGVCDAVPLLSHVTDLVVVTPTALTADIATLADEVRRLLAPRGRAVAGGPLAAIRALAAALERAALQDVSWEPLDGGAAWLRARGPPLRHDARWAANRPQYLRRVARWRTSSCCMSSRAPW